MAQQKAKKDSDAIRYLIHQRLEARMQVETLTFPGDHLDEDTIGAFLEGRLGEAGSSLIISHLIACPSCLHTSAQLIRIECQFPDESEAAAPDESPSRLRQFLEGLASRTMPSSLEDSVFAYHDPSKAPDQAPGEAKRQTDSGTESEDESENKDLD